MSKEQTPIEKLIEYIKSRGLTYGEKAVLDRWIEEDKAEREQYAQAKVLEALEKHYKEVEVLCRNAHLLGMKETLPGYPKPETIDEWIETEVKPKYE